MRFSQRIGKSPIKTSLEKEELSIELKNLLWSELLTNIINDKKYTNYDMIFYRSVWMDFFKWPVDEIPMNYNFGLDYDVADRTIREWFYFAEWFNVLDFIEFCVNYDKNKFAPNFNEIFKAEMSAYRFVSGNLVEINSKEEIVEIENAIKNTDKFLSVKTHLTRAIELYSDKKNPDYRNSIKESISSLESLSKIIVKDDKTTLGQALKKIEKTHNIPNSLKSAFSSLYGYTSDEGGIRHSLLETDVKVEIEEARFMIIACSAFINYLLSKIE